MNKYTNKNWAQKAVAKTGKTREIRTDKPRVTRKPEVPIVRTKKKSF